MTGYWIKIYNNKNNDNNNYKNHTPDTVKTKSDTGLEYVMTVRYLNYCVT